MRRGVTVGPASGFMKAPHFWGCRVNTVTNPQCKSAVASHLRVSGRERRQRVRRGGRHRKRQLRAASQLVAGGAAAVLRAKVRHRMRHRRGRRRGRRAGAHLCTGMMQNPVSVRDMASQVVLRQLSSTPDSRGELQRLMQTTHFTACRSKWKVKALLTRNPPPLTAGAIEPRSKAQMCTGAHRWVARAGVACQRASTPAAAQTPCWQVPIAVQDAGRLLAPTTALLPG